ncbi:MAG: hypothetical protein U5K69_11810 [Balneolaceae bacterium]|nr:hypothetical protein [Balneolaceae bacterium]
MKRTIFTLSLLLAFSIYTAIAQEHPDPQNPENENLAVPANWKVRLDNPDEGAIIGADQDKADIFFVNMVPGWHITTGPAAIFWHPASTAEGSYRAETVIHLFDPQGRNEAFGLFFGGSNLEEDDQTYSYFLLRNSEEYLIKNRSGSETSIVKSWSHAMAMDQYDENSGSSVRNSLAVEVRDDKATFFVNGNEVTSVPASELNVNGIVGLRINHRLNVHVEDLVVAPIE